MRTITLICLCFIFLAQVSHGQSEKILMSYNKSDISKLDITNAEDHDFVLHEDYGQLSFIEGEEYRIVAGNKFSSRSYLVNSKDEVLLTIIAIGGTADVIKFPNGYKVRVKNIDGGYKLVDKTRATLATINVLNGIDNVKVSLNVEGKSKEAQLIKKAMILSLDKFKTYGYHPSRNLFNYYLYPSILGNC